MRPNLQVIRGGLARRPEPVDVGVVDPIAFRLPVFAAHKKNLAAWLRNLTETRIKQGRPVELSYGVAREIADLIEFNLGHTA